MSSSTSSQPGCGSAGNAGVPALPLVHDLAIEALFCHSEDMPDVVHSEADSAGTLGQVLSISARCEIGKLVKQLQALQAQTAILHLKQALCSALLPTPNSGKFLLLQKQVAMLSPAQQAALLAINTAPLASPWPCLHSEGAQGSVNMSRCRKFHRKQAVACLQEWLYSNIKNPYLSLDMKRVLARMSGLSEIQVDHWFNNARKCLLKTRKLKKENLNPDATNCEVLESSSPRMHREEPKNAGKATLQTS